MPLEAINVLRAAIDEVPAVKYALGVAGIAAAGALITSFVGHDRASIIILAGTFVSMILLFVFAKMVMSPNPHTTFPGLILLYAVILFFCSFLFFTVTAFTNYWPEAWAKLLDIESPPPPPPPSLVTEHRGPFEMQPGETHSIGLDLRHGGPVDVIVDSIVPDWTGREQRGTPELIIELCGGSEGSQCPRGLQRGIAGSVRRELTAGPATVKLFNFNTNPPITSSITLRARFESQEAGRRFRFG